MTATIAITGDAQFDQLHARCAVVFDGLGHRVEIERVYRAFPRLHIRRARGTPSWWLQITRTPKGTLVAEFHGELGAEDLGRFTTINLDLDHLLVGALRSHGGPREQELVVALGGQPRPRRGRGRR